MKLKYILFSCFIFIHCICFSASQEQDIENFNFNFKTIDTLGIIFNPALLGYLDENKISIGGFLDFDLKNASYGSSIYFLNPNFSLANAEQTFYENNVFKNEKMFKASFGLKTLPNLFAGISWKFVKISDPSQKKEILFSPSLDLGIIYSMLDKKGNSYNFKCLYQNFAHPNLLWQIKSSINEKQKLDLGVTFNSHQFFSIGVLVELGEEIFAKKIYHEIHLGETHWYQNKKLCFVNEISVRISEATKTSKWVCLGLSYKPEIYIEKTENFWQYFLKNILGSKLVIDPGLKIILSENLLKQIYFLNIGRNF
ncbi:MAG: hypothetical protein ABIB46_02200 [bacterium]